MLPGVVYGPGDTSQAGAMLRQVTAGRRPVVPSSARFCWAHVDDVVDGHVRAMARGTTGQAYMLAGPEHGLAEALQLAARIAGRRGPVVVPGSVVRVAARLTRGLARAEPLRASTATYLGSPAKAESELGWSARPLDSGLRQTIDAERATSR
ncbi:MAG TPA: NAD-dependent epimerase/dehydratase family protein [Actinomycetales bacterium]|nr:NAD-dependent epimerase/dehydratase family protein [Actinomycetales bacterium]